MSVNEKMTALADSVRDLRGTTEKLGIDQMREEVGAAKGDIDAAFSALAEKGVSVPDGAGSDDLAALIAEIEAGGGGDPAAEDALITRTITEYTNNKVSKIGSYAFYSYSNLTNVSFPAATYIGNYAFSYCTNLTSISFPAATSIGSAAFYKCTSLTSISFPAATSIGSDAFYYCANLTNVSFPAATSIGGGAFYLCSNLTNVSFPAATYVDNGAFNKCYGLTSVNLPMAKGLASNAFCNCPSLTTFVLGASTVCILSNSNAFKGTPIASGTGYFYVKASLIASYQTATNWTYFSSQFLAKEDMGV